MFASWSMHETMISSPDRINRPIERETCSVIVVMFWPNTISSGESAFRKSAIAARAEAGAMPGGAISDTLILTAVVEEIDLERNTFKLRGPEGNVREFAARDPENLRRVTRLLAEANL